MYLHSQQLALCLSGTALMDGSEQSFDIHGLHAGHSYQITVSGIRKNAEEKLLLSQNITTSPKAPIFDAKDAVTVDEHSIKLNGKIL